MAKEKKLREAGKGTLRLRKDGRWEGRVYLGRDENCKLITKNVLGKTKTECQKKLEALLEDCEKSADKLPARATPDMKFGDWLKLWYELYLKQTVRPTTQRGYEDRIYLHIIPAIGKIPLNRLRQSDLQRFYAELKTSGRKIRVEKYGPGLSDRMVRGCHTTCSVRPRRRSNRESGAVRRLKPLCPLLPERQGMYPRRRRSRVTSLIRESTAVAGRAGSM